MDGATVVAEQKTAKPAKETEPKESQTGRGVFSLPELIFWLLAAVTCDILSLIPYVGLIFSWPFATAFLFYKWMKGMLRYGIWASIGDFLAETILSTLPGNTADVIITYLIYKAQKIVEKIPGAKNLEKAVTAKIPGKEEPIFDEVKQR